MTDKIIISFGQNVLGYGKLEEKKTNWRQKQIDFVIQIYVMAIKRKPS